MRRRYFFRGHVQGVGFRATACWVARQFEVRGYVRNLPDGRVELLGEGTETELNRFIDELSAQMGAVIKSVESVEEPASETSLEGFVTRY